MKEVPKKHLPEVSGGVHDDGGCIPLPGLDGEYPRNPSNPVGPILLDNDQQQI